MSREDNPLPPSERVKHLKAIIEGEYPEEELATVGENRGQLFIRVPKVISNRLGLQKGDKVLFRTWTSEHKKLNCTIEKVTK